MRDVALEMNQVYKKFKKGEMFDSLRDLVPGMARKVFRRNRAGQLGKREFWALQDISYQVYRGEAFGIIGANGGGKTTSLKLYSGILKPTSGTITVNGTISALIEITAGFHPDLTGYENIFLNGIVLGMRKQEIKKKFDEIVEFSGISEFINTPVKRYSAGMLARLAFSVAAHVNPDILLVDEILSVGDWAFQARCMEKMKSLFKSGRTVVFISHDLRSVASLCERSLLLNRGKVVHIGPTEEVIRKYLTLMSSNGQTSSDDKDVVITEVSLRNSTGESAKFTPGQKAWVDVTVTSKVEMRNLAVSVYINNEEDQYQVFYTSTEQLNYYTFPLAPGETKKLTFELTMHLAHGTYYLGVAVQRYDLREVYDERFPAATIFMDSDADSRGSVNLYPKFYTNELQVGIKRGAKTYHSLVS